MYPYCSDLPLILDAIMTNKSTGVLASLKYYFKLDLKAIDTARRICKRKEVKQYPTVLPQIGLSVLRIVTWSLK